MHSLRFASCAVARRLLKIASRRQLIPEDLQQPTAYTAGSYLPVICLDSVPRDGAFVDHGQRSPTERGDSRQQEIDHIILQNEPISLAQRGFWDFVVAGNYDDWNRRLYTLDCVCHFAASHLGHMVIDEREANRVRSSHLHSASRRGGSEH